MSQTLVNIAPLKCRIDYSKRGLSLGSCFAYEVASRLNKMRLPQITVNPFGMLYNPISISGAIERLASGVHFSESDLCFDGELWHSFAHHHSFSSANPKQMLEAINTTFDEGVEALQKADYVIITFATTWIFRHIGSNRIVANCHTFPETDFVQERLNVKQITETFERIFNAILAGKQVILTINPIMDLQNGLIENSLCKAILRVAIAELCEKCPNVEYFPAYEIMVDELRDYSFYKSDMIHPNLQAVDHIVRRFVDVAMDTEIREVAMILKNFPL